MSAPVTNQSYIQQNNQLFDWAKTATPQQIEAAKQGLPKDSPLLLAIGMGVQYQQQARAPHPQAPQKTVMEQKLGEFAQTSAQGLPSVGGNQMAMQQVDPMRGAGIGVAPENTPAPQQAATGGLVALAQGGEVRRFEEGGDTTLDPLAVLNDPNAQPEDSFYNNIAEYGKKGLIGGLKNVGRQYKQGFNNLYEDVKDLGTDVLYGSEGPPKESLPTPAPETKTKAKDKITDHQGMAGLKKHLSKGEVDPNSYGADAAVAPMLNKFTTPKYSEPPVGKDDVVQEVNPASSAARNEASPTAYEEKEAIKAFRGPEADMSEEVAMAKELARGANKDKWGTALTQGIGGMLAAQTPYVGQALGAGLLSGVSGYQQGAKDEQSANKDLMALQMAQKKALMTGDREAADLYLAQKNAEKTAAAASAAKWAELKYGKDIDLLKEQMHNKSSMEIAQMNADKDYVLTKLKASYENDPKMQTIATNILEQIQTNPTTMNLPPDAKIELAHKYIRNLASDPLGNLNPARGGQASGQQVGNRGITLVP
jgi:hypothetical protein